MLLEGPCCTRVTEGRSDVLRGSRLGGLRTLQKQQNMNKEAKIGNE